MALSLRQLRTPVTVDQVRAGITSLLSGFGYLATAWQSTDANRILVEMFSTLASDATFAIFDIAGSMHAGLAAGPYADDLGTYAYNLPRVQATPTQGVMLLTSTAAAPPHTFAANSLLVAASSDPAAQTYTVTTAGTINPGTTLPINVIATIPGAAGNVPPNLTTLELRTPLVGTSVTNEPSPPTTAVDNWITVPGTDTETDGPGGRYGQRMLGRFDRISPNNTEGAYRAWVFQALPALTDVRIGFATGSGAVRITGRTATGGLTGAQVGTSGTLQIGQILDYLYGVTDGVGRRPINDVLTVASANAVTSPALTCAIFVRSPFASDAVARVTAALLAFEATIPIGGTFLPGDSFGRVLLSALYETVMSQAGVVSCSFPAFAGADALLGVDDIYVAVPSITMTISP